MCVTHGHMLLMKLFLKEFEMHDKQPVEDEIALIDVFMILWKRKIMIILLTLLLGGVAGIVSMMLPPVYRVTAIIEPGKGADGESVERPETIKQNILGGAYDLGIQEVLGLTVAEYPALTVQVPKDTALLNISLEIEKPELGVAILNELLLRVSAMIEERLQYERAQLDNNLKLALVEHTGLVESIKLLTLQTRDTAEKISGLEAARGEALANLASDAMSVLLYSNEIQSKQIYLNNLQMKLNKAVQATNSAEIGVANARLKIAKIKSTNINKVPLVPEKPVRPKKVLIVLLALIAGLMTSTVLAFLIEYVSNARQRLVAEQK